MEEIKDRMVYVLKYFGFTKREFCSRCGLDQCAFNRLIDGESADVLLLVQKIATSIPVINTRWLLIGEGSFLLEEKVKEVSNPNWININIRFAGVILPLRVDPNMEPAFRKIGYSIVDEVNAYRMLHPDYSNERIIRDLSLKLATKVTNTHPSVDNSCRPVNCPLREAAVFVRSRIDVIRDSGPKLPFKLIMGYVLFHLAIDLYLASRKMLKENKWDDEGITKLDTFMEN